MGPTVQVWRTVLPDGDDVQVAVRPWAVNLLLNGEAPSFTFDPLGRLHAAFVGGINYRRSLDNRVLGKWREGQRRQRRWLDPGEAKALVDTAYGLAQRTASQAGLAPPAVRAALHRLSRWDWEALEADALRFAQIYTPVGILPPDQYLALVLQATHGCSHNACTFCTFYRHIPFRIKSPEEFRRHVAAVVDFFGPALAMRRSIFLADANALVIPMPRLLALWDVLAEALGSDGGGEPTGEGPETGGAPPVAAGRSISAAVGAQGFGLQGLPVFAFIDAFHVERKSVADWQALAARGLRRVYIGMESGHDPLLRWLNKPGDAGDVLDAVRQLKAAGLQVSVIVMLGVGGERYAAGHVEDTVRLLNAMPLGRGDIVYFSDFVQLADAPYAQLAAEAGVQPLDEAAMRRQEMAIRHGFVPGDPHNPPQFSRYNIEEFIY